MEMCLVPMVVMPGMCCSNMINCLLRQQICIITCKFNSNNSASPPTTLSCLTYMASLTDDLCQQQHAFKLNNSVSLWRTNTFIGEGRPLYPENFTFWLLENTSFTKSLTLNPAAYSPALYPLSQRGRRGHRVIMSYRRKGHRLFLSVGTLL